MQYKKDLLSVGDLSVEGLIEVIELAKDVKKNPEKYRKKLEGRNIIMIFEKPSTRTRVSFECAMLQLGGHAMEISRGASQLGRGETVADSARTLERYVDAVVARVNSHQTLQEFSENARIPIINALSDIEHPCQVLADLLTVYEVKKKYRGVKMCYVGDGNNVCNSLLLGSAMMGMDISVATPEKYGPRPEITKKAQGIAKKTGSKIDILTDPHKAVKGGDFIYTDVWVSMGQEGEKREIESFSSYQVNKGLLHSAKKDVKVMHCLPAHRDLEISSDVIDGPHSIVWDQAENRLHAQKAVLLKLLK